MSRFRLLTNKVRIAVCILSVSLAVLSGCNPGGSGESQAPSKGFYVSGVSLDTPDWVAANDHADDKAVVTVSFNRAVDKKSVKSAFFIIRNEQTAEEEVLDYTARFSKDSKSVVFISNKTFANIAVKPDSGSSLLYIISIADGRLIDSSGEVLDGDLDGAQGGKYSKILKRVM